MKKFHKIISATFIFLFAFTIITTVVRADETFSYTENLGGNTYNFTSITDCTINRANFLATTPNVTASPCISSAIVDLPSNNPVNVDPLTENKDASSVYTLLAPIGKLVQAPDNMGDYFNIIFKIAIGFCGALAVIMIVIGGVQYMGDESVFGKTEAKSRIMSAVLGLLIALGSYALLNTINPDLLGVGGVDVQSVSAEIEEPPMLTESTNIPAPGTPVGQCSVGLEKIQTNGVTMNLCKSISTDVRTMIALAWSQNIQLSGAAYRSRSDQINLRIANDCPDIYTSPASSCTPPTAIPGSSNHESGLAIDFKCDGQIIRAKDNKCFVWLSANASRYGLKNFAKEPWHWSVDGK